MARQSIPQNEVQQTGIVVDKKLLYAGVGLILLGLLMPAVFTVYTVGLYDTLSIAIREDQEVYILLAALKLVGLNAVRAYPHYLGVFFLVESFSSMRTRRRLAISIIAVCFTIPGVYLVIDAVYGIHYDFGMPAVSMIVMLIILAKIDFSFVNLAKKTLMVAVLITSLQFLDMMPPLWRFPFGRGESSHDIKVAARFLDAEGFLQAMSAIFFAVLLFMAILLLMIIVDENNIRKISEQKELNEHMLMETRMRILENRTYMELRHLVHDLNSPLTSMQALVGVVKMSCEMKGSTIEAEHLGKIEDSIERMSSMISEILHEGTRTVVTIQELLSGLLAQISAAEYVDLIQVDNRAPQVKIEVNKIRFSRMLVNLIENAAYAVERPGGRIQVEVCPVEGEEGPCVQFAVRDNGQGIPEDWLEEVWTEGFSSHGSHGLGLKFVRQVVTQCGGSVRLESRENEGTTAVIVLRQYEENKEDNYGEE